MIRSINGKPDLGSLLPSDSNRTVQNQHPSAERSTDRDRIEISDRARELLHNPELAKRLRVEANIEAGFYNSPQVLHTVAQRLLRDLDHQQNIA
jgi:hypothetical protein